MNRGNNIASGSGSDMASGMPSGNDMASVTDIVSSMETGRGTASGSSTVSDSSTASSSGTATVSDIVNDVTSFSGTASGSSTASDSGTTSGSGVASGSGTTSGSGVASGSGMVSGSVRACGRARNNIDALPHAASADAIRRVALDEDIYEFYIDVKPGFPPCMKYLSDIFKIKVEGKDAQEKDRNLNLFMKTAPNQSLRPDVPVDELFKREIFAYEHIFPEFKMIQNASFSGRDFKRIGFVKSYYTSDKKNKELIILEDLSLKGFMPVGRKARLSLDQVMLVVENLAKFHAFSFVIKHNDFDQFRALVGMIPDFTTNSKAYTDYIVASLDLAANSVRLARHRDKLREGKRKYLAKLREDTADSYSVITHTDCWKNNIMFKFEDDKATDVRFVDYQTLRYGPPAADLLYFLFSSTEGDIRSGHYNTFILHYYKTLRAALHLNIIDVKQVYPERVFDMQIKENSIFALVAGVVCAKKMAVPDEEPLTMEDVTGTGEVRPPEGEDYKDYVKRLGHVVEDFVKHGYL